MSALQATGRVVLVTGCSAGGIGWFTCAEFVKRGCQVFATARSLESMAGLQEMGVATLELDVTKPSSIKTAVSEVIQRAGRIDILVNNAGMTAVCPLAEVDMELFKRVYDTNVTGVVAMVQEVALHMARVGKGQIVNIGSVVGYIPTPWSGTYSSSKAALQAITDVLRLELGLLGIKVMLVTPGAIKSNFGNNSASTFKLKPQQESMYAKWYESIKNRVQLSQSPKSTPTDDFARHTVDAILAGNQPYFAYGYMSSFVVNLLWLPYWVKDFLLVRMFKMR